MLDVMQVFINPMKRGGQEQMPQEGDADDDGEAMEDLLEQIRKEHPEKYAKLQRLQSEMDDLDFE